MSVFGVVGVLESAGWGEDEFHLVGFVSSVESEVEFIMGFRHWVLLMSLLLIE